MPPITNPYIIPPGPEELERVGQIIEYLAAASVDVTYLNEIMSQEEDNNRTKEALEVAAELMLEAAYLSQEETCRTMALAWQLVKQRFQAMRREFYRKTRVLEADSKADPDNVAKMIKFRDFIDQKCVGVNQNTAKFLLIREGYDEEREQSLKQSLEEEQARILEEMGINA